MKWRGWLCSLLFVLLGLSVGGVIINQKNNVSAVSDVTITFNSLTKEGFLCRTNIQDIPNCSDYNYIYINVNYSSPDYTQLLSYSVGVSPNGLSRSYSPLDTLINISDLGSDLNRIYFTSPQGLYDYGVTSIDVTLSENNPFSVGSPSGSLSITENGTYDVTNYAEAVVDVPVPDPEVIPGDYHDDLVSINNAILIVPAVALVVYFFYAIYKMLLGGKTL